MYEPIAFAFPERTYTWSDKPPFNCARSVVQRGQFLLSRRPAFRLSGPRRRAVTFDAARPTGLSTSSPNEGEAMCERRPAKPACSFSRHPDGTSFVPHLPALVADEPKADLRHPALHHISGAGGRVVDQLGNEEVLYRVRIRSCRCRYVRTCGHNAKWQTRALPQDTIRYSASPFRPRYERRPDAFAIGCSIRVSAAQSPQASSRHFITCSRGPTHRISPGAMRQHARTRYNMRFLPIFLTRRDEFFPQLC